MTLRAWAAAATGLTAEALVLALVGLDGAALPWPDQRGASTRPVTTVVQDAGQLQAAAAPTRASRGPGPAKRRALRILSNGCRYSTRGVPRCGTLLGAAYGANTDPSAWERSMRRRLGVHRTYFSGHEVRAGVHQARVDLRQRRIPWISFKLPRSWHSMAAGSGDAWARDLAVRLSRLNGPVWLAFHHEPEGDGDITAWTAMQRRLGPIVRRAAPNVAFTVILTGWHQLNGASRYALESLWPATKVDIVGFDVFNTYGLVKDGTLLTDRTAFERRYFPRFRQFSRARGVAWALAETGHTDRAALVEPRFVRRLYLSVRRHRGIAVSYFNSTHSSAGSWRLNASKGRQFARVLRTTPML